MKRKNAKREDPRIRAAEAFMQAHDSEPEHARQVTDNSLALFDALADLHRLGGRERRLLHAAALMHDVGYATRPMQHHKGSRDLILASNLEGFSTEALRIIACIARYHRKADPNPAHKVYADLPCKAQRVVEKMAAILRVADGLDRCHARSVASLRVECRAETVRVLVRQRAPNAIDIATAIQKGGLFESVFGVALQVVVES